MPFQHSSKMLEIKKPINKSCFDVSAKKLDHMTHATSGGALPTELSTLNKKT